MGDESAPRRRISIGCSIAALLLLLPRPALPSDYTVSLLGVQTSDTVPVSDSFAVADAFGERYASARAGEDLGVLVAARAFAPNSLITISRGTDAQALAYYDDLVINGPTATVEATLHLTYFVHLFQSRSVWTGPAGSFESRAGGAVTLYAWFGGDPAIIQVELDPSRDIYEVSGTNGLRQLVAFGDLAVEVFAPGGYVGLLGHDVFYLAGEIELTAEVPTGQPLILDLILQASASAESFDKAGATSRIDAQNSLGVPRGRTVVDLPPGYTANSPSLGIVDGFAVPEPSISALLTAGVAMLVARGSRSRVGGTSRST